MAINPALTPLNVVSAVFCLQDECLFNFLKMINLKGFKYSSIGWTTWMATVRSCSSKLVKQERVYDEYSLTALGVIDRFAISNDVV